MAQKTCLNCGNYHNNDLCDSCHYTKSSTPSHWISTNRWYDKIKTMNMDEMSEFLSRFSLYANAKRSEESSFTSNDVKVWLASEAEKSNG